MRINIAVLLFALLTSCASSQTLQDMPERSDYAVLVDVQEIYPLAIHEGIWYDVKACIFREHGIALGAEFSNVKIYIARLLITEDGRLAYGMTLFDMNMQPLAVVIDRDYWLHPGTISHEYEHYLLAALTEDQIKCEMYVPSLTISQRTMPTDSLRYYRGLPESMGPNGALIRW